MPKITFEKAQQRLNNQYKNEDLTLIEYEKTKSPCKIKCNTCGEIYSFQRYCDATKNSKKFICKKCGKKYYIQQKFEQSLRDRFPGEPFELLEFTDTQKKTSVKCLNCGKISTYTFAATIYQGNHICSCYSEEQAIKERTKIWNNFVNFIDNSSSWDLIDKEIPLTGLSKTIGCICKNCGKINYKTIYDYQRGIRCSCYRKKEEIKNQIKQICKDENYKLLTKGNIVFRDRIELQHSCGFKYSVKAQSFLQGYGRCPQCHKRKSRGERKIINFLKNKNIDYERELGVNIENHLLRFDFYIPSIKLYIEYQGEQHFKSVDFFGEEEKLKERQYYDELKKNYAHKNGYFLEISYKDFDNIPTILESTVQRLGENHTLKREETGEANS